MELNHLDGYMGEILRINLTNEYVTKERNSSLELPFGIDNCVLGE